MGGKVFIRCQNIRVLLFAGPSLAFVYHHWGCFAAPAWHYNSAVYLRSPQKRIQGMNEIPGSNPSTFQPIERLHSLEACETHCQFPPAPSSFQMRKPSSTAIMGYRLHLLLSRDHYFPGILWDKRRGDGLSCLPLQSSLSFPPSLTLPLSREAITQPAFRQTETDTAETRLLPLDKWVPFRPHGAPPFLQCIMHSPFLFADCLLCFLWGGGGTL